MNTYALISCICIAQGKPNSLKQAINCFFNQNYPNKELVLGYYKNDHTSQALTEKISTDQDLKLIAFPYCAGQSDEEIVKHAIIKSTGLFLCMWNEEDWHHESRLSYQFNSMQIVGERFQASLLTKLWMYNYLTGESYLSATKLWERTMLFKKDTYLQNYKSENKTQQEFIQVLSAKKMLYAIEGAPFLYIKYYHDDDIATDLDDQSKDKIISLLG